MNLIDLIVDRGNHETIDLVFSVPIDEVGAEVWFTVRSGCAVAIEETSDPPYLQKRLSTGGIVRTIASAASIALTPADTALLTSSISNYDVQLYLPSTGAVTTTQRGRFIINWRATGAIAP